MADPRDILKFIEQVYGDELHDWQSTFLEDILRQPRSKEQTFYGYDMGGPDGDMTTVVKCTATEDGVMQIRGISYDTYIVDDVDESVIDMKLVDGVYCAP